MSEDKVSHNIVPGIDDMEYVEMFNLDPAVAYTPKINDAILHKVYDDNIAHYVAEGDTPEEAKMKANKQLQIGKRTVGQAKSKK